MVALIAAAIIHLLLHGIAEGADIPVTFSLYTPRIANESMYTNDVETMTNPNFDVCADTIFIITGLNQIRDDPQIVTSAQLIAGRGFNVIVVNYNTKSYVLEVPKTAKKIVEFLESLEKDTGANPNHFILVGISLGAHVAGQVGRQHRIGRIMGVDPSGPLYDVMDDALRLDDSDADFVDAIHTSNVAGSLRSRIGHVNYVINGGFGQPLCETFDFYCHHVRGAFLLLASFSVCNVQFRQCFSYWAFKLGLCRSRPTIAFGMSLDYKNAPRDGSMYYYDTSSTQFPYCGPEEQQLPKMQPMFC